MHTSFRSGTRFAFSKTPTPPPPPPAPVSVSNNKIYVRYFDEEVASSARNICDRTYISIAEVNINSNDNNGNDDDDDDDDDDNNNNYDNNNNDNNCIHRAPFHVKHVQVR